MDFSKFQSHLSNLDKLEFRTPTRPFVPLLFPTQIAGARLRTGQHDLAVTCFYARSYAISVLVIGVGGSKHSPETSSTPCPRRATPRPTSRPLSTRPREMIRLSGGLGG